MSEFTSEFHELQATDVLQLAHQRKVDGSRFVQLLAVNTSDGIDLVYSYMLDGVLDNYVVRGVKKDQEIPSITDDFLSAFVFENEAHDLFGVKITGIAIDFEGNFYALSQKEPMTIISPEKKAEMEKAAKIAKAKAAKAAAEKAKAAKAAAEAAPAAGAEEAKEGE